MQFGINQSKRPSLGTSEQLPVILQDRDLSFLRGLFESRVMTSEHARMLYFENRNEAAKKRLQKLKAAALISERPRRTFEPSVLFLTLKGLEILHRRGVLAEYPLFDLPALDRRARVSNLTISHELEVMDVKTAFLTAIKQSPAFTITEFSTWPLLNEFTVFHPGLNGAAVSIKPDGFVRIHEMEAMGRKYERAFFLELDRSSETQQTLINKAVGYFEYYKSGGFAERNGGTREAFKKYPFRVLIVCKSAERRNNTALRLIQNNPSIVAQVYLSTLAETTLDPFGMIWLTPAAYRDAVKGSPFDIDRSLRSKTYRRESEREAYIEKHSVKCSVLS